MRSVTREILEAGFEIRITGPTSVIEKDGEVFTAPPEDADAAGIPAVLRSGAWREAAPSVGGFRILGGEED